MGTEPQSVPVFDEEMGGALIDAARISVMAAMRDFPEPSSALVVPGDEPRHTVGDCLAEAMMWLDAARGLSMQGKAPTSLHVVTGGGRTRRTRSVRRASRTRSRR